MISGIVPLALVLMAAQAPLMSPETAALIARLARPVPARTAYTEVRFARLLREPLVLRGLLEYGGEDRLGKRIEAPYRETTTIADGVARVEREGRAPREISLAHAPGLAALLDGFSALLGGDAPALDSRYTVELRIDGTAWTLVLKPRDAELARHLRDIVVDGRGTEPACFSLEEADGDASVLLLDELAHAPLARSPTRAQLAGVCGRVGA